jgi:hypothetical protein
VKLQTCRRHPNAGPFMATCSGCTQELFNIEQANRARSAAPAALAAIHATGARILSAAFVGDALLVATHQPNAWLPYSVDTFRRPTVAETDPELADWARREPSDWVLVEQAGSHVEADVPRMLAEAADYAREIGLAPKKIVLV